MMMCNMVIYKCLDCWIVRCLRIIKKNNRKKAKKFGGLKKTL